MINSLSLSLNKLNRNFEELLSQLNLTRKDIFEICKIKGKVNFSFLELPEMEKVLKTLNIDLSELENNNICHRTVKEQLNGNNLAIKSELIGNKGTRVKTIESALSLLDNSTKADILRKYQIKEDIFESGARLVSAELIKSIFKDLSKFSYSKTSEIVGHVNCKSFLSTQFDRELQQFKSPADAYAYFIEYCTTVVERNMNYSIVSATPKRIIFKYETKEEVKDHFGVKHFGNINFCQNIQGFFEELVKYRYTYPATVRKRSCAHLGQTCCSYEIVFDGIVTH